MKINNCPFCNEPKNGGDVLDIGHLAFCVHCTKCECYGPKAESRELAIEKWNSFKCQTNKTQNIIEAADRLVRNYSKYFIGHEDDIESKLLLSTNIMELSIKLEKAKSE